MKRIKLRGILGDDILIELFPPVYGIETREFQTIEGKSVVDVSDSFTPFEDPAN
jgi:hypothetical protein